MARKGAKEGKDPFKDLDKDFKTLVDNGDETVTRRLIMETAINEAMNQVAKDMDLDLAEKKEQAAEAGADYAASTKQNKLKIKYATEILEANGKL